MDVDVVGRRDCCSLFADWLFVVADLLTNNKKIEEEEEENAKIDHILPKNR